MRFEKYLQGPSLSKSEWCTMHCVLLEKINGSAVLFKNLFCWFMLLTSVKGVGGLKHQYYMFYRF